MILSTLLVGRTKRDRLTIYLYVTAKEMKRVCLCVADIGNKLQKRGMNGLVFCR